MTTLKLKQLDPSPLNPRKKIPSEALLEMAASIRTHGVLQPLVVRPNGKAGSYEIVCGERRYRAACAAELDEVPVVIRELSDTEALEIMVLENEQRQDVSAAERAAGYAALVEQHGLSVEDVANRIGKSASTVRNAIRLGRLPSVAHEALAAGKISVSVAEVLARIPGEQNRLAACKEVIAGNYGGEPMSLRTVQKVVVGQYCRQLKAAPFGQRDGELLPEAGTCQECPKRAGNLQKQDPDSYAGIRADVCTDPPCYQNKVNAWQKRTLEQAKHVGQKVLSDKQAQKLFPYNHGQLAWGCGYVDLDNTCHLDPKGRTYGQLLLSHVSLGAIVLACDRQGRLHQLVAEKHAQEILKTKHKIGCSSRQSSAAFRTKAQTAEDKRRKEREAKERQDRRQQLCDVRAKARILLNNVREDAAPLLRLLVKAATDKLWGEARDELFALHGIKGKTAGDRQQAWHDSLDDQQAQMLAALLVEVLFCNEQYRYQKPLVPHFLEALGLAPKKRGRPKKQPAAR